MNTEKARGP